MLTHSHRVTHSRLLGCWSTEWPGSFVWRTFRHKSYTEAEKQLLHLGLGLCFLSLRPWRRLLYFPCKKRRLHNYNFVTLAEVFLSRVARDSWMLFLVLFLTHTCPRLNSAVSLLHALFSFIRPWRYELQVCFLLVWSSVYLIRDCIFLLHFL